MCSTLNGHQLDIRHRHLEKPVAAHFNSKGHSLQELFIFIIKQIHREEASYYRVKELELLDSDFPIAGPSGTQSQSIGRKTRRNNGFIDKVLDLMDS